MCFEPTEEAANQEAKILENCQAVVVLEIPKEWKKMGGKRLANYIEERLQGEYPWRAHVESIGDPVTDKLSALECVFDVEPMTCSTILRCPACGGKPVLWEYQGEKYCHSSVNDGEVDFFHHSHSPEVSLFDSNMFCGDCCIPLKLPFEMKVNID